MKNHFGVAGCLVAAGILSCCSLQKPAKVVIERADSPSPEEKPKMDEGLSGEIPFDPRWNWQNYLGFRPANGAEAEVNPPRMSWPYEPDVVSDWSKECPPREFVLQIARNPDFANPEVERRVVWNFDNALAPLPSGAWYWRVGYAAPGKEVDRWSVARRFTVTDNTPKWDRSLLDNPLAGLRKQHPRLGPADGDWAGFRQRMQADPVTDQIWKGLQAEGEEVLKSDWWKNGFPDTDRDPNGVSRKKYSAIFKEIGNQLGTALFLYKAGGDERFRPALDYALKVAAFPQGGETSPEFNGGSDKWGTRWAFHLARAYDWCYDELDDSQRELLRKAVAWRVSATLDSASSWRNASGGVHADGIAMFSQSHPFENFNQVMKGLMLIAGDGSDADGLVRPALNYMTGVGGSHGPDEAWNEAGAYVFFKGGGALEAALTVQLTVPDLKLGESPWYRRLGHFMINFCWPGLKRQGFGEYTLDMSNQEQQGNLLKCLRLVAVLTKDEVCQKVADELTDSGVQGRDMEMELFLVAADRLGMPRAGGSLPPSMLYKTAGWIFAGTFDPSDREAAKDGVRFAVMARPQGGYSHSYAHDGAYVWHAFGQTLTDGGGSTSYADAFARHSMSHNGILVEGKSSYLRGFRDAYPYSARPLYWKDSGDAIAWSVDLTGTFLCEPGKGGGGYSYTQEFPAEWGYSDLGYWRRHFIFFKGRYLAVYDEIGVREGTPPARFTWLHHFPADAAAVEEKGGDALRQLDYQVGKVRAGVFQRSSVQATSRLIAGRETLVNPVTGTDFWPQIEKAYTKREKNVHSWELWSDQVWNVQTAPVRQASFLTILVPSREGKAVPKVEFMGDAVARITDVEGAVSVSFDPEALADYRLDAPAIDSFAADSDPYRFPFDGQRATVPDAGGLPVIWLRTDDFQDAAWVDRWKETGGADVYADGQGLHINTRSLGSQLALAAAFPADGVLLFDVARVEGSGGVSVRYGESRVSLDLKTGPETRVVTTSGGKLRVYGGGKILQETQLVISSGVMPEMILETTGLDITWKRVRVGREEGVKP